MQVWDAMYKDGDIVGEQLIASQPLDSPFQLMQEYITGTRYIRIVEAGSSRIY